MSQGDDGTQADAPAVAADGSGLSSVQRGVRACLLVLVTAVAFFGTAHLVQIAAPRHLPIVDIKRAYFTAHKDEFTTVYIGSSVFHRHVIPSIVDAGASASGVPEHSFNFGAPHMTYAEAVLLLDEIIAMQPKRLRRVVIDAALFSDSGKHNQFSARHIWWHNLEETRHIVGYVWDEKNAWTKHRERMSVDVLAFIRNVTSAGRLAEEFRVAWDPDYIEPDEDDIPVRDDGYRTLDELRAPGVVARTRKFRRRPAKYAKKVARHRKRHSAAPSPYKTNALLRLIDRIEDAGMEPVLFEGPLVKPRLRLDPEILQRAWFITLSHPKTYPKLYEFELHFDDSHLTDAGARVLSQELGKVLGEGPP